MALFNITPRQLKTEFDGASQSGLVTECLAAERKRKLPAGLLIAITSRETNCVNKLGDGGHGRGVFQIDDRAT